MKCLILAGGYATRLYPLTLHKSKALLNIKEKYILDYIMDNIISSTNHIDEFIIITNDTFLDDFKKWHQKKKLETKITIVSDGSTCEENKVGAVSALIKTIDYLKINDDIFVLAGDNLLDFSLKYIFDDFNKNNESYIMYYFEPELSKLQKTGVIEIDENNYIINMEEKPIHPRSNYAIPPFYWLKKEDLKILLEIFDENKKVDSMGEIIKNLCTKTKIKAQLMKGKRYDISLKLKKEIIKQ